ncbi:amino acid adenylation domain-containing protein [Micromonospora sp. WMMD961]|uniref:non-ribosomal peptide synthetase n=1 Tax=Micromonospora sp. WMMD961 TaxID=3016100 RepID=UPI002417597F|nr:non-ribosomal peptide synthetase [Micromonospora sp. WMMD961]MDG4782323.1 amino acid adenylation domain-containing protein [Micromonospora sp. WMMD961]
MTVAAGPVDSAAIRAELAAALRVDPGSLADDTDLFGAGLDSLTLIRLVAQLRRAGHDVTFEDLVADPTLAGWDRALSGPAAVVPPPSAAVDPSAPFDLATMQYAYWIGRQDEQPFGDVAAHFYVEFDGHAVDPDRLRAALAAVTARHGMLRARFDAEGRQRIAAAARTPLVVHDLTGAHQVDRELDRLRAHYTHRRMDVENGEVFTVALSLLPGGATRLHVDLDMLVADALSMRILLGDLHTLYHDPDADLPTITASFPEYLAAHRDSAEVARERARAWWTRRLDELAAGPQLPIRPDAGRPGAVARSVRLHHWLAPARRERLLRRAAAHGVTAAAALATAFAEVIGAFSDDRRFLLNLPLFAREPLVDGADLLVGDFSSSVLLDVDTTGRPPFTERATRVQADLRAAIGHGAYAGVEVLRDLSRRAGSPVLAPVVYTSALGLGEIYGESMQRTFGTPSWIISQGPQVWLDAQVTELDGGLLLNWDVRLDVLADGVAEAAFSVYRGLVDALTDDDEAWRRPVGALVPPGQLAVRERVNATAASGPAACLHDGFFAHARATPERTALIDAGREVSYGDLADRALRLRALLDAEGVRPGDTVVITLPKGAAQVAAALAVLACGAAYLPVSIDQPPHRRRLIHAAAGARVALTDPAHQEAVTDAGGVTPLLLSAADGYAPLAPAPVDRRAVAYVLFTSGSTGEPKGVEVSHAAAMNTVLALNRRFGVGPADRVLTLSALEFDLSVYDTFGMLTAGGALVLVAEDQRRDAAAWWHLVTTYGVTVWNTVPALLDMLLVAGAGRPAPTLRAVLLGGDVVGLDLPARLRRSAPDCRFAALGGMTEAAIHSTVFEVDQVDPAWPSMPWGAPLDNVLCRVTDADGRDRPDLVTGELWVGGAGVAEGYRGDPERTAGRFVTHASTRWYRSGDLARYRPDGLLEFLGRADHQVKVRGHRIELGEIEAALAAHPEVEHAVAVVTATGLAAAVVTAAPLPADLDAWLAERLPEHMRCDTVTALPALPLTANGKVDRARLRLLLDAVAGDRRATRTGGPPRGEIEALVAAAWSDLLGVPEVGRGDSFFALGGDSLLATRLLVRLRTAGLSGARLAALFTRPTLADFAADLRRGTDTPATVVTGDLARRHEPFPPTDVQRAYFVGRDERLPLGGVGTWQYTEFDGADLDLDRLRAAWQRLVERHEMLRAVFDGADAQRILATAPPVEIAVADVGDDDPTAALESMRAARSHQLTDLSRWPLFDLAAVRYRQDGRQRTRLAVGLDYIVFDALSIMTLYTELDRLYRDPDTELPAIDVSFRDYLRQVRPDPETELRDQRYWEARLVDLPPAPQLPTVRHPSEVSRPRFTRRRHQLPAHRWSALRARARQHGVTPSTVLLAAYAEVLGAWSARRDLTVTLTLFNRRDVHPHIYRVLGDFTTLSLADYRPAGGGFLADVTALHARMGADLDHREISPAWLLRRLARSTGSMEAMPVVFTSAIGVGDGVSMDRSDGFPPEVWGVSQSPQVSLDNQVLESRGGLQVTWDAVDDLFVPGVLDDMFGAYTALLDRLADADWEAPLPDLLPAAQRATRLRVNDTAVPVPRRRLHDAFFDAARDHPHRVALIWHGPDGVGELTHGALAEKALRVASGLRERGVRPGDAVAVTLPKGPDQVVAVLGVLAAGAVYVPVGVEQPALRRDRCYRDSGAVLVLDAPVLAQVADAEPLPAPVERGPDEPAYVIFTSGSTGAPKGVEVAHDAAANTCADINARFGVGAHDRVLALSALDFDLSVYDIFGVLGAGGALVLPAEDERRDAARWLRLVREHRVTLWNTVPTLLDMLLVAAEPEPLPPGLRLALVSGDWVGLDLPGRFSRATAHRPDGPAALVALGGATEASIWSNAIEVAAVPTHWRSVPYGFPLANQTYRVVDDAGRDRPDWVPGELWIGGRGVALGYRGDPARTAEKFVEDAAGRWYRTGDLGRYWPDGTLEFLGRADHQVKVGGHRIELGEIEAACEAYPGSGRAAVVAVGERTRRRLHAFVEAGDADPTTVADGLRAFLAERLPAYAVPAAVAVLPSLPLTANGKVDRAALQHDAAHGVAASAAPPTGPIETALAGIWADLLGDRVDDRAANFFALGGDSVAALRLVAAIRQRWGVDVPIARFLAAPTLTDLAIELSALIENDYDFGSL